MAEHLLLTENARFGGETAAGLMVNRCAFTSRDMGADWASAFTYAVVMGWDADPDDYYEPGSSAWEELAEKHGWDDALIAFLRDAHGRFCELAQTQPRLPEPEANAGEGGAG